MGDPLKAIFGFLLFLAITISPAYADEFRVASSAAPTTNGQTQNLTSTGLGTPSCALFMASYGTVNGTAVTDGMLAFGLFDGTRQYAISSVSESTGGTTDTGQQTSTSNALQTLLNTSQAVDGTATAGWITDGVQLTWADAPPSAYLVKALLIGGSGIANCYVNTATTPSTVDTATDVTDPGFQPDVILVFSPNATTTHNRISIGIVTRDGSNTQRSGSFNDQNGNGTSNVLGMLNTIRVANNGAGSLGNVSISNFDASGFDLFLRDVTGVTQTVGYMAIKFNNRQFKLLTSASPGATGSATITGAGFTPQFGLMIDGEWDTVDALRSTDNGETFGLSLFTAGASACVSYFSEDNTVTASTASLTNAKPTCLQKDGALFRQADFTAFTNDGVTFNYTTHTGGATQRAVLFVEQAPPGLPIRRFAR